MSVDLDTTAHVVTDVSERRRVLEADVAARHRNREPVDDPIADAPVIRVSFS